MTNALSGVRDEDRGAVAVETVALIAAAIGLCLLVAIPGDTARHAPVDGGSEAPLPTAVTSNHFGD